MRRGNGKKVGDRVRAEKTIRLIGALMAILVIGLTGVLVAAQFRADKSAVQAQVHRDAHLVANQFAWMFQASAQSLQRMEQAITAVPDVTTRTVSDIDDAVQDLSPDFIYSAYSAAGDIILSSHENPVVFNVTDRAYFRDLRDGVARVVISPMVTDRMTGRQAIIIARRLERDGAFAGVASIAIPTDNLHELARTLDMPSVATITLVRMDGMMIARMPPVEPFSAPGAQIYDEVKKKEDGTYQSTADADGVVRIFGYWKMKDWPIIAIVGIDRTTAFADFWEQAWAAIWLAIPALVALLWLMWQLALTLRREEARKAELEAANERGNFLLREIHHRVKNNLQTVISLIRLERVPADVKQSLLSRISAMVAVHEGMYRSDQFETVEVAPYLDRLVRDVAQGYGGGIGIETEVVPVALSGDRAMQLGLLVNEIVSNAFKHAFRDGVPGHLRVELRHRDAQDLVLTISDDGPGFDQNTVQKNMGSRLVEAFASQLGGELSIDSTSGTTVRVVFPQELATHPA